MDEMQIMRTTVKFLFYICCSRENSTACCQKYPMHLSFSLSCRAHYQVFEWSLFGSSFIQVHPLASGIMPKTKIVMVAVFIRIRVRSTKKRIREHQTFCRADLMHDRNKCFSRSHQHERGHFISFVRIAVKGCRAMLVSFNYMIGEIRIWFLVECTCVWVDGVTAERFHPVHSCLWPPNCLINASIEQQIHLRNNNSKVHAVNRKRTGSSSGLEHMRGRRKVTSFFRFMVPTFGCIVHKYIFHSLGFLAFCVISTRIPISHNTRTPLRKNYYSALLQLSYKLLVSGARSLLKFLFL